LGRDCGIGDGLKALWANGDDGIWKDREDMEDRKEFEDLEHWEE
jgi:hypothetical protein